MPVVVRAGTVWSEFAYPYVACSNSGSWLHPQEAPRMRWDVSCQTVYLTINKYLGVRVHTFQAPYCAQACAIYLKKIIMVCARVTSTVSRPYSGTTPETLLFLQSSRGHNNDIRSANTNSWGFDHQKFNMHLMTVPVTPEQQLTFWQKVVQNLYLRVTKFPCLIFVGCVCIPVRLGSVRM